MSEDTNIKKVKINELILLFKKGLFEEVLLKGSDFIEEYSNVPFAFNLIGMAEIRLNKFEESIISFEKAVKLDKTYAEAFNNLSTSLINLGEFEKAIEELKKAIDLKKDYSNAYNNLASAYSDLGDYKNALDTFNKLLSINPEYPELKSNIIKLLTFYNPQNKNLNEFTKVNEKLKLIKLHYGNDIGLTDGDVINFYKKCNNIVSKNFYDFEYKLSQIWRRNTHDLNCARHFDVFRNFSVIPEFCFECFKIQVELNSIIDLFKLFFVFDNLQLNNNRTRKCLVEMRTIGSGTYKGLIYCRGYDEASSIKDSIDEIINKNLNKRIKINLKRGCTEFAIKYPQYNKLNDSPDNFMKYNKEWKEKENIIDNKIPKKNRVNQRILNNSLNGVTLNDFLIMKNWLMYAKMVGDENYKKFDDKIVISDFMRKNISNQINQRKDEFKKNI